MKRSRFTTLVLLLTAFAALRAQDAQLSGELMHSGTTVVSSHAPEMAFDDDVSTYFVASDVNFAWLGIDLDA